MEVYIAWGLHKIRHVYENLGPLKVWPPPLESLDSSKFYFSDTRPIERCPDLCMVARPGSTIYDSSFPPSTFQSPIQALVEFVVRHGKADPTRSTGWRLDLSNAGQAFEGNTNDGAGDFKRPKILCGDLVFREDPNGTLVRAILGRLVDSTCRAGKMMCREMRKPHSLNPKRYKEYALMLQEFMYGEFSFVESITLQLLNLSLGDHGEEHVDVLNDHRSSYDCTITKVMNFVDGNRHLYSLKIVCGFRKRLGDFYSVQMSRIETILVNARTMLSEIDASYARLVSSHDGAYHPDSMPTWANIDYLHFDDNSPWERRRVTQTVSQDSLVIVTGVSRGLWLSPALSSIHTLSPKLDQVGLMQLLLVMSWQNSFQHFWEIAQRMEVDGDNIMERKYPIYEYYRVAHQLFYRQGKEKGQEMFGGECPRFGPIGFDFKDAFGTNEAPNYEAVDHVCRCLFQLLDDVNALVDSNNRKLNTLVDSNDRNLILEIVSKASDSIRSKAKCELGSFRIMILLQGAMYLGLRVNPGTRLRNLFFPVRGSGSWSHLMETKVSETEIEQVCLEIARELSTPDHVVTMDEVEVILCESKNGRLLKKYDLVIKGQSLFKFDDNGAPVMKEYGKHEWVPVVTTTYRL
jgi:hypothetical protein